MEQTKLPMLYRYVGYTLASLLAATIVFNGVFFYNEAGYATHVRTIYSLNSMP